MKIMTVKCDDCGEMHERKTRKKSTDGKLRCKKCYNKKQNNKLSNIESKKQYDKSEAGKHRKYIKSIESLYGMSEKKYKDMLESQGGVCAICGLSNIKDRNLCIDHNHESLKVRGLLCDNCNRAVGLLNDDVKNVKSLLLYLAKNNERQTMDEYYLDMAMLASTRSKDQSTKVGAIIVNNGAIVSTGYNGFPRGCNDNSEERQQRPLKYNWTAHAEENALLNACRSGVSTIGGICYVTPLKPCSRCTRGLIQAGVKEIVCRQGAINPRWSEDYLIADEMIRESLITYREVNQ